MKVISESTTIEEVAALVSESLSRARITAVLSGGGAVQIYSNGLYVSRDLDFVSPAPVKEIARVVKALGFEPASGRHFVHPTCPFTLEFPPWPLAVGHALIHEWAGRSVAHGVIQMVTATQRPRMVDATRCVSMGCFRDIRWSVAVGSVFVRNPTLLADPGAEIDQPAALAAERAARERLRPLDGPIAGRTENDARRHRNLTCRSTA